MALYWLVRYDVKLTTTHDPNMDVSLLCVPR
jgi:hypothetical protein